MTRLEKCWAIHTGRSLARKQPQANLLPYKVILHTYLPMKMEQSVPKNIYKIQTPGELPRRKYTTGRNLPSRYQTLRWQNRKVQHCSYYCLYRIILKLDVTTLTQNKCDYVGGGYTWLHPGSHTTRRAPEPAEDP